MQQIIRQGFVENDDGFCATLVTKGKRGMRQPEQALLLTRLAIIDQPLPPSGVRRVVVNNE